MAWEKLTHEQFDRVDEATDELEAALKAMRDTCTDHNESQRFSRLIANHVDPLNERMESIYLAKVSWDRRREAEAEKEI